MAQMHDRFPVLSRGSARARPLLAMAVAMGLAAVVPQVAEAQVSTITVTGSTPGLTQGTLTGSVGGFTGGYVSVFYVPTASGTFTFGQSSAPFDSVMFLATGVFSPANPGAVIGQVDDSDG